MSTLRVERSGFLTAVQDAGRPGLAHLGVSTSGAADALALRAGNLLVGNHESTPALEMTLTGGAFMFDADVLVVLSGAEFDATLAGAALPMWMPTRIRAGQRLDVGAARTGARCYLCVSGGIDVPRLLGSASTHLQTSLGGLAGRALRSGDVLPLGAPATLPRVSPDVERIRRRYAPGPIRVTPGPQCDLFGDLRESPLVTSAYTVREQSNRMGIRLQGQPLPAGHGEMLTEGVSLGAIQVPADGQPIILFVEHQTTGGYPKIANVCSADMHRVGQLRPRDTVRFTPVTFEQAHALFLELESEIARLRP
jgi:antagonist of KipI